MHARLGTALSCTTIHFDRPESMSFSALDIHGRASQGRGPISYVSFLGDEAFDRVGSSGLSLGGLTRETVVPRVVAH